MATRLDKEATALVMGFVHRLRTLRVLDPACGSGNFLYVSLRLLMDLEQAGSFFAGELGLQPFFPLARTRASSSASRTTTTPTSSRRPRSGLATSSGTTTTRAASPREPVLEAMDNIKEMDAILAYDADGKPFEPEWPEADVIVGNPPFLGDKKMRAELGDQYVDALRAV